MGFKDDVEQSSSGDYYKFAEGENKLRILSEPVKKVSRFRYGICYEGAPYCTDLPDGEKLSVKFACWAIDRKSGRQVILDLPMTVAKPLKELMVSEEYGFEDFPMPYDITVKAVGAGTKEVEYSVIAARKNSELTQEELDEFAKKTPITEILEKQKEKARAQNSTPVESGEMPADEPVGDIPF